MEDGEVVEALRVFALQTRFERLYRGGGLEDQDARTLAACVELGDVWAAVQVLAAEERVGRGR
jgi:hypothetical protein